MNHTTIELTIDPRGVAELRLNRPDKRNAMSAEMIAELHDAAKAMGQNDDVRAVVLKANGPVFCAGADLNWMMAQIEAGRETRMVEAKKLAMMLKALNDMPKPLIAAVQGDAYGGGIGLLAVCDSVIAVEQTRFALTETRLGLIPATIGPYVAARLGETHCRRVFMSARTFDANEAITLDLISYTVTKDQLDASLESEVQPYLKVAPGAVARAKALTRFLGPKIDEEVIDETIRQLAEAWETEEARHGIQAFLSKTKPRWAHG